MQIRLISIYLFFLFDLANKFAGNQYTFLVYVYASTLILINFILSKKKIKIKSYQVYGIFFLFLLLLLSIIGMFRGNALNYFVFDLVNFGVPVILYLQFGSKSLNFYQTDFIKLARYIIVTAIIFAFAHTIYYGLQISSISTGRGVLGDEGVQLSAKYFLYPSLLLYPLSIIEKEKKYRWVFHIGLLLFLFYSLAMGSRGTTPIAFLVFIVTNYYRIYESFSLKNFFRLEFFGGLVAVFILLIGILQIPSISISFEYLIYRFNHQDISNGRLTEYEEILKGLEGIQFYIGRGIGAPNTFWIFKNVKGGINSAHFGWAFLMLKGGLIFTIFLYSWITITGFALLKSKVLFPFAISIFCFLLLELSHTNFNALINVTILFLVMSAVSNRNKINEEA